MRALFLAVSLAFILPAGAQDSSEPLKDAPAMTRPPLAAREAELESTQRDLARR